MAGGTAIKLKKPSPLLVVSRVALLDWLMRVILAPGTRASAISRTVPDIDGVFCAGATDTNRRMAAAENAASISGTVRDIADALVPGAKITLINQSSKAKIGRASCRERV